VKIFPVLTPAVQRRVNRVVERLRKAFDGRGVTIGARSLILVISANAVQSALAGLALTICTTATLAGTTIVITATVTKAIA
jgi:hypothetical protein